nr:hypothetical protein [Tanacetum cinerariifolium]
MIDYVSIVETDMVIHTAKTNMMKLVVEIECFDMSFDEFEKETGSSDGLQPKQADMSCVHALNEPYLHEIYVVPSKHEADLFLCFPQLFPLAPEVYVIKYKQLKKFVSPELVVRIPRSDNSSQERHHVIDSINGIITIFETLEQLDQSLVGKIRVVS